MANDHFEKIRTILIRNLRDVFYDPQAVAPLSGFQSDGTWSDLDYDDHSRGSNWSPELHLSRMIALASVQPELALKALKAWILKAPSSPNWWWWCIGIPQSLCRTILLIGPEKIPSGLMELLEPVIRKTYVYTPGTGEKHTGQNLVWVEGIRICTGLLYHDPALIEEGRSVILSELTIAPAGTEGLQDDFSYHQHGTQNQVGNYGMSFLTEQIRWARAFQGTEFAYTKEQTGLLDSFFMNCMRWTLMNGVMDYNYCGRQLWDGEPAEKYRRICKLGKSLKQLVSEKRRAEYENFFADPDCLTGAVIFPRSACMIYRSPDGWIFSLKMNSPKIIGCETINSENMQCRYQGDGVGFFGNMNRYKNYPALFSQRMLPGTTEVQNRVPLTCKWHRNKKGSYALLADFPFVIAALRLDTKDIQADKVWFCTPSGVTCEGSAICSDSDAPVVTTVDQYCLDSEKDFPLAVSGKGIVRTVKRRRGDWQKSFLEFPSKIVSGNVVTLFIDHGVKPVNAGYRYVLRKQGVKVEEEKRLKTSSSRIHALLSGDLILIAAFVKGSFLLENGKRCNAEPGIALWTAEGKLLQKADFRIQ